MNQRPSLPFPSANLRAKRRQFRDIRDLTRFQVHASELTWAQASFLAGLPQAPSDYDPFGTPDQVQAATDRWRDVLSGMVAVGDLSLGAVM